MEDSEIFSILLGCCFIPWPFSSSNTKCLASEVVEMWVPPPWPIKPLRAPIFPCSTVRKSRSSFCNKSLTLEFFIMSIDKISNLYYCLYLNYDQVWVQDGTSFNQQVGISFPSMKIVKVQNSTDWDAHFWELGSAKTSSMGEPPSISQYDTEEVEMRRPKKSHGQGHLRH